ncbi:flagellar hook-associated protein FlgK [Limimaricola pyoseonensis]|uniref:Flagellar hook-associated protein 1 n=1 Tax=Limimaricola pyoseonensis TaxID=521013 RepID=A0A1G7KC35_9RHOB|nr:flagellar hook-associated protein FlgK [Limimaricola pyoseonensis]SDF34429.1 flagellar hook-associated protein 1 FlgK [Limimaricola pyoseonensis]
MSITGAFLNARSGLAAAEGWADIAATNIANANRTGYARRSAPLTQLPGGGVAMTGFQRASDAALEQAHRKEMARVATQHATASALEVYAATLGEIDSQTGIPGRIAQFQSALDTLAATPSDPALQEAAVRAADGVAASLRSASSTLQRSEEGLRQAVVEDVAEINARLAKVVELNQQIEGQQFGTERRAMFEDQLSESLDGLAELIDVRVQHDGAGRISVYTAAGAALVEDNTLYSLEFDTDATAARLSVNGVDITPGIEGARGSEEGALAGRLGFLARDLPRMELQLDELARGLVMGFEQADATVRGVAGQAGLFTDDGSAFNAMQVTGLAGRIAVNEVVTAEGGESWRIRDGIGAAGPGPASDGTQLLGFVAALTQTEEFDATAGLGTRRTIGDFAAGVVSAHQQLRNDALGRAEAFAAGRDAIQSSRQSVQGVNVDDELQQLMLIEQSYAANATVMKTLGEMLDTLLNAVR